MALINYSDSDGSDQEAVAKATPSHQKPQNTTNKPGFQKLVDSSNPQKIRVNFTDPKQEVAPRKDGSEPPAKRAKLGGSGLNDFNSLLPAPKRPAATNGLGRGGLGRGVNLKTGATLGFSREPMPEREMPDQGHRTETSGLEISGSDGGEQTGDSQMTAQSNPPEKKDDEQPKKKATMFKPLSVARKPHKKKPPSTPSATDLLAAASIQSKEAHSTAVSKVSLFSSLVSVDDLAHEQIGAPKANGSYQPMLYQADTIDPALLDPTITLDFETSDPANETLPNDDGNSDQPQSLDAIADSLNLSTSARRQLLGRNASRHNTSAVKIASFNTDAEYAANEELRQAGETVQHNAVRAIAPGKHSLKQLVNVAAMQKDALEESFAEGRRNKKEVGGRYGW